MIVSEVASVATALYMTHLTLQVQSNSQITDIPVNERREIQG